ncbi:MAG: hypothetical protein Q9222_002515 [Ikaeria aurantiellina]
MAQSNKSDDYLLSRDCFASTRLICQHYLWQQIIQFYLHPSIPSLKPDAAVADVATGTGVWLLELAQQHPTVKCLGLDINAVQCPPKAWLPSNMEFETWDMFEEPPPALQARLDVVHIRLIGLVIRQDPTSAIKNMAMLLKAGGYLQWEEMDIARTVIATVDESVNADAMTYMDTKMKGHDQRYWVPRLVETLNENGFHDAKRYDVEPRRDFLKYHSDMHILAWAEITEHQPEGSERKKEFSRLTENAQEETKFCPFTLNTRCSPRRV